MTFTAMRSNISGTSRSTQKTCSRRPSRTFDAAERVQVPVRILDVSNRTDRDSDTYRRWRLHTGQAQHPADSAPLRLSESHLRRELRRARPRAPLAAEGRVHTQLWSARPEVRRRLQLHSVHGRFA